MPETNNALNGDGNRLNTTEIPLNINVGLSSIIGCQFHATVGLQNPDGSHEVSLQMFLSSNPTHQAYDLGSMGLFLDGPSINMSITPTIAGGPVQEGFVANEISYDLNVSLVSSNGGKAVRIDGEVSTKWTVGAVDMELLDPPIIARLQPTENPA